jgi:Methyltransferase domain
MGREQASEEVRTFFDDQQAGDQYASLKDMTRELDVEAARRLNSVVTGDTLSVGGIWDFFSWGEAVTSLTVLDLSPEMLKAYCPANATGVVGDLYDQEFPPQSFDSIVFPLMLHHTPQGTWRSCEQRIEVALDRVRPWLREGGHVFILEYCPHPAWSPVQRALLPFTKWFLARFHQPLVVMYTRSFYERVLNERFGSGDTYRVDPEGFNYWKLYPIFMSIRWLRMPLAVYPKLHVMIAPALTADTPSSYGRSPWFRSPR